MATVRPTRGRAAHGGRRAGPFLATTTTSSGAPLGVSGFWVDSRAVCQAGKEIKLPPAMAGERTPPPLSACQAGCSCRFGPFSAAVPSGLHFLHYTPGLPLLLLLGHDHRRKCQPKAFSGFCRAGMIFEIQHLLFFFLTISAIYHKMKLTNWLIIN